MDYKQNLPLSELTAISILDGRNRKNIVELASLVSEFNIIRTRIEIEAKYLIALSKIGVIKTLNSQEKNKLENFAENLSLKDAEKIKKIEEQTQHDVKAIERAFRNFLEKTSLEDVLEMVHIGLTSEDINNLTYRLILSRVTHQIIIPTLNMLIKELVKLADGNKTVAMLGRTHGQAAVPTTLGKEVIVFASRLDKEVKELKKRKLMGKLTGAIGNLSALKITYPDINWINFSKNFVSSFGLDPNIITTQIDPYDDMIAYFQNYIRINGIILGFDQDMWRYISDDWFVQEVGENEVGSSTMPQKVNPIRFENSEGNLGKADALFEYFSRKLAISRLQRDLSDSTVIRDMGVPLGWSLLAYKNTFVQLSRVRPNYTQIRESLNKDWAILGEAAQTIMRKSGVADPYSIIAKLIKGKHLSQEGWLSLVAQLPLEKMEKEQLQSLTPENYLGVAVELTKIAIKDIKKQ